MEKLKTTKKPIFKLCLNIEVLYLILDIELQIK